jgi:hypothetical protein
MQICRFLSKGIAAMLLCLGTVGLLAVSAAAQSGFQSGSTGADGALVFYTPPDGRYGHAMAYDAARQVVVLFGGVSDSGSTWEWDNTRWTQKTPADTPGRRYYHAMVYDNARQVVVLFGGYDANSGAYSNETWEYDGTTWTQQAPAAAPSARYGPAMVYDSTRQVIVLFGGYVSSVGYSNETWEYDGTTWTQRTPTTAPSGRSDHAMIYDSARQVVVLFGGWKSAYSDETWEYDGTTWTQHTSATSPSGRSDHTMAYDSARQVTVLFGGHSNNSNNNETWLWNGTSWSAPAQVQTAPVIDMSTRPNGIWHYTTIDVAAGVRVSFRNNDANTPVVWLATGLVRVAGEINLDGASGSANADPGNEAPGGPGGFAGGLGGRRVTFNGSYAGTPGEGPGGGLPGTAQSEQGGAGGYATPGSGSLGGPTYGNHLIRPLVGGSGGGGGAASNSSDGGNGGGAILIATSDTIQVHGSIHAKGGSISCKASCGGYGSGGSIRLMANRIEGNGSLSAISGGGGQGRIRLEAFFVQSSLSRNPAHTFAPPLTVGLDDSLGSIRITDMAGQVVPQPPAGDTNTPDVIFTAAGPVTITLATTNIPTGTPLSVRIAAAGQVITVQSTPTNASGVATATADVPAGVGTVQVFATYVP